MRIYDRAYLLLIEVGLISWQCQYPPIRKEEIGAMPKQDATMNRGRIAGNWKLVKGQIKQQCRKLADDDPEIVEDKKDQVTGKLPEKYGRGREQAARELDSYIKTI
jgi:uncharacterized protein YjbJ (UPF0337 family)